MDGQAVGRFRPPSQRGRRLASWSGVSVARIAAAERQRHGRGHLQPEAGLGHGLGLLELDGERGALIAERADAVRVRQVDDQEQDQGGHARDRDRDRGGPGCPQDRDQHRTDREQGDHAQREVVTVGGLYVAPRLAPGRDEMEGGRELRRQQRKRSDDARVGQQALGVKTGSRWRPAGVHVPHSPRRSHPRRRKACPPLRAAPRSVLAGRARRARRVRLAGGPRAAGR